MKHSVSSVCLQSHIAVMIATLVLTIVGIIVIVIHAAGLWLTSTVSLKFNDKMVYDINNSMYVGTI